MPYKMSVVDMDNLNLKEQVSKCFLKTKLNVGCTSTVLQDNHLRFVEVSAKF